MKPIAREVIAKIIWLGIAAGLGAIFNGIVGAWVLLAVVATFFLFTQLIQLARLLRWVQKMPIHSSATPSARGAWRAVYSALSRRSRDVAEQHVQMESALDRFRRAAEAMPDGVLILDGNRTIEWINLQGQIYLNLVPSSDYGLPITHLLREPEFAKYLNGEHADAPLILHTQRAPGHTLEVQVVPFAGGRRVMLVRDITRIAKLESMRRDFVANVSHELRTPLTVVAGFIETLRDQIDDIAQSDAKKFLHLAHEQTRRMQVLLQDLLTLATLETDQPPLAEKTSVQTLLQEVEAEAQALATSGHQISIESNTDLADVELLGSYHELRSACSNLAANAVRYSPQGGHIRLSWQQHADGSARLDVTDEGIGIDAKHVPRISERFYRVDSGRSRQTGGTGLGLAIVKHVLERHQSRLEIRSTLGQGSTFSAIFPAERVLFARKQLP